MRHKPTIIRTCERCGGSFLAQVSEVRRNGAKYCSHVCAYAALKGRRAADKWCTAPCAACGAAMTFRHYRPKTFCSPKCAALGKPHPAPDPTKKTTVLCPTCGKVFEAWVRRPRVYCSHSCRAKAQNVRTAYTSTCDWCGAGVETIPSQHARFCSRRCFGEWQSANVRGLSHPAFGLQRGRPKHLPPPLTKRCGVCEAEFAVKPSHASRRRFCSRACLAVAQAAQYSEGASPLIGALVYRGEDHPNWRGGYEPYYGPTWRPAMRAARQRDQVCQRCGKSPKQLRRALDVHHVKPFRAFGLHRHAEANAPDNLACYCTSCHLIVEWETNGRAMLNGELWSSHPALKPDERPRWIGPTTPPERLRRGEQHPRARWTEADVREMRRAYEAKEMTQVALAARYGATQSAISAIVRRETWKHVP